MGCANSSSNAPQNVLNRQLLFDFPMPKCERQKTELIQQPIDSGIFVGD